jgi:hypothetical protein
MPEAIGLPVIVKVLTAIHRGDKPAAPVAQPGRSIHIARLAYPQAFSALFPRLLHSKRALR